MGSGRNAWWSGEEKEEVPRTTEYYWWEAIIMEEEAKTTREKKRCTIFSNHGTVKSRLDSSDYTTTLSPSSYGSIESIGDRRLSETAVKLLMENELYLLSR